MSKIDWKQRAQQADLSVKNFINGEYTECTGNNCINKYSPRDGIPLYEFKAGTGEEVDQAVAAAKEAYHSGIWRSQSVHHRKAVLQKFKELIEKNHEELALLDCIDVGKPISNALNEDLPSASMSLNSYIEHMDKLLSPCGMDGADFAFQVRKPLGVVGAIIGWNYPLVMAINKIGPALAMGNSLVLKPSEFSPLSATRLGKLALEAGVPAGVLNIVNGAGNTTGTHLAHHNDIDLLSFTGSSATGKKMQIAAGQSNLKRLVLECGGKSPFIVFDDCPQDLDFVAAVVVSMAFRNQGQLCVSGSRLLVQASIKNKLMPKIIEQVQQLKPQDPFNPDANFGALINESQMNKVSGFIETGKKEGATLMIGGNRANNNDINAQGYFIEPTVFNNVNPDSTIAQQEIFGPVLSVISFNDENEAIEIANNSSYGLAAYAATTDVARTKRLAQSLNCGYITVFSSSTPGDGYVELLSEPHKQSGFGGEIGLEGLLSNSITSTMHIRS